MRTFGTLRWIWGFVSQKLTEWWNDLADILSDRSGWVPVVFI